MHIPSNNLQQFDDNGRSVLSVVDSFPNISKKTYLRPAHQERKEYVKNKKSIKTIEEGLRECKWTGEDFNDQ